MVHFEWHLPFNSSVQNKTTRGFLPELFVPKPGAVPGEQKTTSYIGESVMDESMGDLMIYR